MSIACRRLYLFALFTFIVIPNSVFAAPSIWQGPYIGVYLGGGIGNNHASTNVGMLTDASYFTTSADINAVNDSGTSTNTPSSVIGGIQVGHDWAWQQMVYGVIFDYGAMPLSASKKANNLSYPDNPNAYSMYTSIDTNWLLTFRGRLGYQALLHWPSLVYVTGGMALTQLKVKNNFSDNSSLAGGGSGSVSNNQIGWTAGFGVELAALNHMSINFEYLFVDVPSVKVSSFISNTQGGFGVPEQSLTSPFTTKGQFYANLLKVEINYRFDE